MQFDAEKYRGLERKLLGVADTQLSLPERVGVIRDEGAMAAAGAVPVAEALAAEFLSLPIFPELTPEQQRHIAGALRDLLVRASVTSHAA